MPDSFGKIKSGLKKGEMHDRMEHQRHLKSLKQRLSQVGNWNDRRKNTQDPLAHPVYFFKGKNRQNDFSLTGYEKALQKHYDTEAANMPIFDRAESNLLARRTDQENRPSPGIEKLMANIDLMEKQSKDVRHVKTLPMQDLRKLKVDFKSDLQKIDQEIDSRYSSII